MKRMLGTLLVTALLCTALPLALAESPIGESGKLRDYAFTLVGAETEVNSFFECTMLTLHFTFTNGSNSTLYSVPLEVRARQNGMDLDCIAMPLSVEGGSIVPGVTVPFKYTFLLENEQDEFTYTINIFFNEGDGTFERTFGLSGLVGTGTESQEQSGSQASGFQLSQLFGGIMNQKRDEPVMTYELGIDVFESIPAIVGERECTMADPGDRYGVNDQEYAYNSATVRDDLLTYIDYLGERGFEVVKGASLVEPGNGELAAFSEEPGKVISVRLYWTQDSYRIHLSKLDGIPSVIKDQGDVQADPAIQEQGEALLGAEAYEEALAFYDGALAEHPGVAAYYHGRGQALLWMDRLWEALDALNTAIELDGTCWEYYGDRGYVYYYLDLKAEALADFAEAVDLDPTEDVAHYNLAYVQAEMGALEDAVLTCAFGISAFPDSGDLWYLLGDVQFSLGHYKEAENAYNEAAALYGHAAENFENYTETQKIRTD